MKDFGISWSRSRTVRWSQERSTARVQFSRPSRRSQISLCSPTHCRWSMGLRRHAKFARACPKLNLVFAMHDNETLIEELLKAGAKGYVRKSDAKRCLLEAIEALAANRAYFSYASQTLLEENPAKRALPQPTLTERQRAVVLLVAEGYSTKQIARLLNLSAKTVDTHRRDIKDKLNLSKSTELVRYAIRNKLVKP